MRLQSQALYELRANYWDTYPQRIAAITAEDVQRVARKYLDPASLQMFAVGDAAKAREPLAKYGVVESFNAEANLCRRKAATTSPPLWLSFCACQSHMRPMHHGDRRIAPASDCVFLASFLSLFNGAKLENPARIMLRRDRPIACALSQETLEVWFSTCGRRRVVHFLNGTELLYRHIILHLSS